VQTQPNTVSIVAAPDKFRGTATALEIAEAIVDGANASGATGVVVPVADGGEGTLDVLARGGGSLRRARVRGPLGQQVEATWLLRGTTAYIEMAQAAGLRLTDGAEGNDPMGASTAGVGELCVIALGAGCRRIVVTLGGSATTDGGLGALDAMRPHARFRGVDLVVAADVETRFADAARVFGPQKGATAAQVAMLTARLAHLADRYRTEFGVDVAGIEGSGAAGGLAGGLLALGATMSSGFALVAEGVGLADAMVGADLVVTGEGHLDDESFHGKVVGGVCAMAAEAGAAVLVVVGDRDPDVVLPAGVDVVSLVERFGREQAMWDPRSCVSDVVASYVAGRS
jgi:glycerate 2-kinase